MKKNILEAVIVMSAFAASILFMSCGETKQKDFSVIEDIPTVQAFTNDAVPDAVIEKIVKAGMNAQSAMNSQPWHFSVVTNQEILKGIGETMKANMPKPPVGISDDKKGPPPAGAKAKAGMGDSPLAIIVSGRDKGDFDAGLATQLMTVEAALLGYGTKIITSPTIVLNGPDKEAYKKTLNIPDDMSVKGVILIGKIDQKTDEVGSATVRKSKNEMVSYIK